MVGGDKHISAEMAAVNSRQLALYFAANITRQQNRLDTNIYQQNT